MRLQTVRLISLLLLFLVFSPGTLLAQEQGSGNLQVSLGGDEGFTLPVRIIILLTLLTFIPLPAVSAPGP